MNNNIFNSKNTKLILAMAVVLSVIYWAQPYISDFTNSDKTTTPLPNLDPHATLPSVDQSQPTSAQNLPAGADPFKAHIEKNGLAGQTSSNAKSPASNANNATATASSTNSSSPGADPFKAFMDQQKKQSKDAGISPFGK
jgi:uncharacterized protein involved in copper resistance